MNTITLCENGNMYDVTYRKLKPNEIKTIEKNYIKIDGTPYELISKMRTNLITITPEMSEKVKQNYQFN